MTDTVDILIFSGQSNMQGQTEACPTSNTPVEGALEYRLLSDSLIPLRHPVGEELGDSIISGAHLGNGSLIPDFCRAYTEKTGRKAVAVHVAKGATTIAQWQRETERYKLALEKITSAVNKVRELGTVGKIYLIWLQGESDGIELTPKEKYIELMIRFKNDLKADANIDKFGIIKVGYFLSLFGHLSPEEKIRFTESDNTIMEAQEELTSLDKDFVMLSRICPRICNMPEYINPEALGHYNNRGMELIGRDAANALALIR